jgi:hypothetical protein
VTFGVATPARSGLPRCVVLPYQRAVPTTPADPNGCTCPVSFPVRCSLPRYTGGSASASLLSRPAQASLTLRPADSFSRPRRPLSQGLSPPITRISCLSATRPNRLLSRWSLPPLATRPCGAHCAKSPCGPLETGTASGRFCARGRPARSITPRIGPASCPDRRPSRPVTNRSSHTDESCCRVSHKPESHIRASPD